jgi:uncharacterized protein YkwD
LLVRVRASPRVPYESVSTWRTAVLAGVVALALTAPADARADSCEGEDVPITAAAEAAEPVQLCLVNVHRAANGLPPLTQDPALRSAARQHSRWMDDNDRLCHTPTIPDPGPCDGTPDSRASAAGYPFSTGENIAWTNSPGYSSREMFELWHNSPGHNTNMLYPGYVTAGVGFVTGSHGVVGTQMFGVTDNGATDTAVDLLRKSGCPAAEADVAADEARAKRAKRKLRKADTRAEKRKAKRKLKRAKAALAGAKADERAQCHPTTYAGSSLSPP